MSTTIQRKSEVFPILNHVVDATLGSKGVAYLSAVSVREVLEAFPGSINVDISNRDQAGNVAVRATNEGMTAIFGAAQESHIEPSSKSSTLFEIEDNVPIPPPRRGIQNEPRYPFTLLNRGQSFFVPATPERPNPVKALASTVSSANKRMEKLGKKFAIRADIKLGRNGEEIHGARIWRSA